MQAQRNYQNQQGGTSMAGLLGRPRVPPAEAFRAFQESEGLPPVRGATPREEDRTPTPEPPEDDQPVLLGNHRDAWVFGAADPNSGTAQLLEVARGLGALLRTGWRPLRTIYLLSWSGEEYGLLGCPLSALTVTLLC